MVKGDVFVVSGAGGDMGLATARRLSGEGTLLLVDVAGERLDEAVASLRVAGAQAETMRCDVSSADDMARLADRVRALGRFRALAHTAGLSPVMAEPERILEVDLGGTVRILSALEPLVEPGSAAVLVASIAGYMPFPAEIEQLLDDPSTPDFRQRVESGLGQPLDSGAAYALAKRGVIRLAERLAPVWGRRGGRIVSVSPGLMDTGMGRMELERQPVMATMAQATPVQRGRGALPGTAEDIATAVAFLVSDGASFISGCDLRVDGGLIGAGPHLGGA